MDDLYPGQRYQRQRQTGPDQLLPGGVGVAKHWCREAKPRRPQQRHTLDSELVADQVKAHPNTGGDR